MLWASVEPQPVRAQGVAPPSTCVTLAANGARYCGELVEEVPAQHIVLKLATGEVKRFEWGELARPAPPPVPPAPAAAPPVSPGPSPGPVPLPGSGVRVTISSSNPRAELHSQIGETAVPMTHVINNIAYTSTAIVPVWSPVCRAPCGLVVSRHANYIIRGEGIRPSSVFSLLNTPSDVNLSVKTGSLGSFWGGLMLVSVLGTIGVVGGGTTVAMAEVFAANPSFSRTTVNTMRGVGYPLLAAGVLGIAGGIVLLVTSRTTVHLDSGERLAGLRRSRQRPVYLSSAGLLF